MGTYDQLKRIQQRATAEAGRDGVSLSSHLPGDAAREGERNEERNGGNVTDERCVWRSALMVYERCKPALMAAKTAEESLAPYRLLHDECAELGEGGILAKHLAQAVYGALEEAWMHRLVARHHQPYNDCGR